MKLIGNRGRTAHLVPGPVCAPHPAQSGDPNPGKINTAFVERQNLTMRMGMRRFTRATNGHSKKLTNHDAAQAIHFMHYNVARPHKSLANSCSRTLAMAAGLADHVWSMKEIAALLD